MANYLWLEDIDPPRIIDEALELFGVRERVGKEDNPAILAWARETNLEQTYIADSIPWCGLFAAVVVKRAAFRFPPSPLWARNWLKFGQKTKEPSLGDVLVFSREGGGGHVGFYVAEDDKAFHVLGGNQGDSVSIVRISKDRLLGARRPLWKIKQPESVKPYRVAASGILSENEA